MRQLHLAQIFALLASLGSLAGFALLLLWPSGQSCSSTISQSPAPQTICTATSIAASMAPGTLAAVLLLSVAFSVLPVLFARRAWVQYAWAGLIVAFFFISFGVDMWLLPAAMLAAASGASMPTA